MLCVVLLDTVKHLNDLMRQMLPAGTGVSADRITDQEGLPEYPEEAKRLANAVTKRRNEFIVGRRCARSALAQAGLKPCALAPDENRVPQWPVGAVGSISHSVDLCCAVVARSDAIACLGVDLETTTRISSGVIERITHPLERDYVKDDPARGSLIFSAKEAFFKAQFPRWKKWVNFDDLAFQVDASSDRLAVLEAAAHLPADLRSAIKNMQFRYAFLDNYVLTLCWLEAH